MARRVKPEEYAARRTQILATALVLIREKGYQEMTISDILTALDISKGAFYHYFDSKHALLDGIVDTMGTDALTALREAVDAPAADAMTRLRGYLLSAVGWKAAHADELATIARMWRNENNAVLKQRIAEQAVRGQAPLLATIIRQGAGDGVFAVTHPDEAATIIAGMGLNLGDDLIAAFTAPVDRTAAAHRLVWAHLEALERILGAPAGSLTGLTQQIVGAMAFDL
ncbi:TetR/AcrR family transcriptional regulator [Nonomuraea soli]|uniref:AcrR family transcriptional regulator n=1 Tax=Nonomuraea soli TaxID=1032476 RepID=A0A7W0CI17_9ACTN|nr:TetR/AcrR family transcriptional regulator [Nonomuraea soli]MBA2891576.1 AcrR family transcriptional regulator [Nonomuraea soli]